MAAGNDWTGAQMLMALDLTSAGATARVIAGRLGKSRGAVIGMLNRIRADLDKVPDTARKIENRNGGMPAGWWQAGLKRQRG